MINISPQTVCLCADCSPAWFWPPFWLCCISSSKVCLHSNSSLENISMPVEIYTLNLIQCAQKWCYLNTNCIEMVQKVSCTNNKRNTFYYTPRPLCVLRGGFPSEHDLPRIYGSFFHYYNIINAKPSLKKKKDKTEWLIK